MRRFILALVVALIGIVGSAGPDALANGARSVVVDLNTSRSVSVTINRDEAKSLYVLICAINASECTVANAANSQKVVRFDCFFKRGVHITPHGCRDYDESAGDHFYYPASAVSIPWRPNAPLNNGLLPGGASYTLRIFESGTGEVNSFTEVAVREISFPKYSFEYDIAPSIQGEALVGQTLTINEPKWTPVPQDVDIRWYRCKKAIPKIEDISQMSFDDRPFTWAYQYTSNADCAPINQNGSLSDEPPPMSDLSINAGDSITTQATVGFTTYKITDLDINTFITVAITVGAGEREYWTASTPVIEKKTMPVNQVAPTSTFTKTKKIKKLQVGAAVTATTGTWKWANTTTFQWYNCSKKQRSTSELNAKQCKTIKRASKATYKTKKADKGRFLVVPVTAANELGSTVVYATSLGKIK
jgi:hypothetical protein